MKTILVPTDFSKHAQWALQMAVKIARKAKSKILLLHIVEHPIADSFNVEGQIAVDQGWEDKLFTLKLIEQGRTKLLEAADALTAEGVDVRVALRMGNPFHGIRTEILEQEAELVVMGASGHSTFDELARGSNSDKVVRYAKCPVLTVHEEPGDQPFKDIVYATSLADREKDFGHVVKRLQEIFGSNVHLVRINTPMNFQPDHMVKSAMIQFAKKLMLQNYTLNMVSDWDEENGIIHFASTISANLICMATHGYRGLSHIFIGSIAEDVVKHTTKPVLTYVMRS